MVPRGRRLLATWAQCSESVWVHGLDPEALAAGAAKRRADARRIFGGRATFVAPRALGYELPTSGTPELAFAGKSNVGKSSLIGALVGEPRLLRRSKTPGCTRSVNFFAVGRPAAAAARAPKGRRRRGGDVEAQAAAAARLFVVDLPGFGFAKRSDEEISAFSRATLDYLAARPRHVLRQALVLCDARRGPNEEILDAFSELRVAHRVVLTKADLASTVEVATALQATLDRLRRPKRSSLMPVVHVVSSKTGFGIEDLRAHLMDVAFDDDAPPY